MGRNLVRVLLFPVALYAGIMYSCYEVVWYCMIVGKLHWIDVGKTPIRAWADLMRDLAHGIGSRGKG